MTQQQNHLHDVFMWTQRKKKTPDFELYTKMTQSTPAELRAFKKSHPGQYDAYKKWYCTQNKITLWANAGFLEEGMA